MTLENFQHFMLDADGNGNIDIEEVVAVLVQSDSSSVDSITIDHTFKVRQVTHVLANYTFIIYLDAYGNGYSRIII